LNKIKDKEHEIKEKRSSEASDTTCATADSFDDIDRDDHIDGENRVSFDLPQDFMKKKTKGVIDTKKKNISPCET